MGNHPSENANTEELLAHPERIDDFLANAFSTYAQTGNTADLLESLRVAARVKGITTMAKEIGMSRRGLQYALSGKGEPHFSTVYNILQALGYWLLPVRKNTV